VETETERDAGNSPVLSGFQAGWRHYHWWCWWWWLCTVITM